MVKGIATIQLIDTDGNVVTEQVEENLFNNGLEYLLTPQYNLQNSVYNNLSTPITSLMAGVLLWDEEIDEDPDIYTPVAGVSTIGYGGGSTNLADTKQGYHNDNESGEITNGYRHVWDFATDKANGTIKGLSLTTIGNGTYGLENANSVLSIGQTINFSNLAKIYYNSNYITCAGVSNYDVIYIDTINGEKSLCIKKDALNPNKVKLIHDLNRSDLVPDYYIGLSDIGITALYPYNMFYFFDDDYFYISVSSSSKSYLKYSMELEYIETVDLSFACISSSYHPIGIMDGMLFVNYSTNIYVYDMDTENLLYTISTTRSATAKAYMYKKNGHYVSVIASGNGTNPQVRIDLELETSLTYKGITLSVTDFLSTKFGAIRATNFYPFQDIFFTINNLDTAITKTNEYTMKIIYDLTQEEESEE